MQIHNTGDKPLAVFLIPADASARSTQILAPGETAEFELEPGDSVKTRIATEITDPVPAASQPTPEA